MPEITRRESFYAARGNSSRRHVKTMHIETDGAIVNITVGLTDSEGRAVTHVSISPDDETRGGDGEGRIWHQDGARIIREHDPYDECADATCRHYRREHNGPDGHCAGEYEYESDAGPVHGPCDCSGFRTTPV